MYTPLQSLYILKFGKFIYFFGSHIPTHATTGLWETRCLRWEGFVKQMGFKPEAKVTDWWWVTNR